MFMKTRKNILPQPHRQKNIENEMYTILRSLPNVLITGHQGFLTNEALQELQAQLCKFEWHLTTVFAKTS
jgi:phosphoglycerate dehydrogenase-like enzyme